MRIPMLAIHLNRDIGTEGFKPNKQTHCVPVLATAIRKSMAGSAGKGLGLRRRGHHAVPCRTALCTVMDSVRQGTAGAWPGRHCMLACSVADCLLPEGHSQVRGVRVMQPRQLWSCSTVRAHMYIAASPLHPPQHCLV